MPAVCGGCRLVVAEAPRRGCAASPGSLSCRVDFGSRPPPARPRPRVAPRAVPRRTGIMSLTFPSYLALSVAAAAAVFGHAAYMHRYLYRTVVHLGSSKVATLVRLCRFAGGVGGGGGLLSRAGSPCALAAREEVVGAVAAVGAHRP